MVEWAGMTLEYVPIKSILLTKIKLSNKIYSITKVQNKNVLNLFIIMKYAVIQTGGKQYKVKKGDIIKIEKIEANENQEIEFNNVLLLFNDEDEKEVKIGTPLVKDAVVKAKVLEHGRDKKISIIKYKPKVRYRKKLGHRQPYTKVKILDIK